MLAGWESVLAPLIFTAVAIFTRLYKIGLSNIVTWDEAQYVHPPLPVPERCESRASVLIAAVTQLWQVWKLLHQA